MKKLSMVILVIASVAVACKKDSFDAANLHERLVGKWIFLSAESTSDFASPGNPKPIVLYGKPGDYFLFGADGKLSYIMFGTSHTTLYSIGNRGEIEFDDNRYTIEKLTASRLELSYRENNYDNTERTYYNFRR